MNEGTREIWKSRILDPLQHMDRNLDRDLPIEEIASVAHFSSYHFCRVFHGIIGEPPSQFRALRKSQPSLPVPSGCHCCPGIGIRTFNPVTKGDLVMDGRIVDLQQMRVLCVGHVGPYNMMGEAFERLGDLVMRAGIDVTKSQWLAIFHDDPDTVAQAELRSDACVTLRDGNAGMDDPQARTAIIPGGMYATTRHAGSYSGLGKAWGEFVSGWIPVNGYRPRCAPCFEIYVKGMGDGCPENEFITDIYEPVEPLS